MIERILNALPAATFAELVGWKSDDEPANPASPSPGPDTIIVTLELCDGRWTQRTR
jgi:hypothetical protein